MDLKSIELKQESSFQLLHPVSSEPLYADDAKKKPMTITVAGTDSDLYRTVVKEINSRKLNKRNRKVDLDVIESEALELLARCTTKFENIVFDGKPLTADDAESLYKDVKWIREQVDEAMVDRARFLSM